MSDAPIEPRKYLYGNNVVSIGEHVISRGKAVRKNNCRHKNVSYDTDERRVYCHDCESTIEAFDAFMMLADTFESAWSHVQRELDALKQAKEHNLISRAAKKIDEAWRRKNMVPCCPHCSKAILPEDVVDGFSSVSKEWELKRRQHQEKKQ